jgi:hypothetical protein
MSELGSVAAGGRMVPSDNLSFAKKLWLDGCLGDEHRRFGIALTEGLCGWGDDYSG